MKNKTCVRCRKKPREIDYLCKDCHNELIRWEVMHEAEES